MAKNSVNFGVIGAGGIAFRRTIPGMLKAKNCRLAAVMDPVGVERVASEFGVAKAYTSEADLLADPDVEAVYIASPVHCHLKQIQMAAAAGKHILCEKPLTMTVAQTKEAVAACKQAKVYLQEGYMMKFHGAHAAVKQMIDEGRLGKIVSMRAQLSCWYPKMEGAWRQDPKLGGGGALIDMATHLYDLLAWFAGPVRRVAAMVSTLVQDYKSDDASTTLLEFKSARRPPWIASTASRTRPAERDWRSTAPRAPCWPKARSAKASAACWRSCNRHTRPGMTPSKARMWPASSRKRRSPKSIPTRPSARTLRTASSNAARPR